MTGGERYLEQQAKRMRKEYQLRRNNDWLSPQQTQRLVLRDAPSVFKDRLHHILYPPGNDDDNSIPAHQAMSTLVFQSLHSAAASPDLQGMGGNAATIIGSSQQGKTSLINSLLRLFGFLHPNLVFPQTDLLPTNTKDHCGLPFPLRLRYCPKYEIVAQRWDSQRLQNVMLKVAEHALAQNADFFEELESGFLSVDTGSFLEFVAKHRIDDGSTPYIPSLSAVESLGADGGVEVHDFTHGMQSPPLNPSIEVFDEVNTFLRQLVQDTNWFRYEHVTLNCPSQLLKYLGAGSQCEAGTFILDLPGVGIIHDNNLLIEELVYRETLQAGTIIILTGERNLTKDVLDILRGSVFERILDPFVVPRPTVAITNSRYLRGLKKEDMEEWRRATLLGDLGWQKEVQVFVDDMFTGRRHRDLQSIEPELFPNDLEGYMESRQGACEKGVSMLVGYILRLSQEALIASVMDVLDSAISVMKMVDQLWQAERVSWKSLRSCRLLKEVKGLQDEEVQRYLDSELSPFKQRGIFGFSVPHKAGLKTDGSQREYIDNLFLEQNRKLAIRFEKLKSSKADIKNEIPKLVKDSLLQIASQWDEDVGYPAFRRFLSHVEHISHLVYEQWTRKRFTGVRRDGIEDQNQVVTRQFFLTYLRATVTATIKEDVFKYTLTHGFRLQAWNLDLTERSKAIGGRRGRSASWETNKIWSSLQDVMENKKRYFQDLVLEHVTLQSPSVKQLIRLLKQVILNTFEECERNLTVVLDALQKIASGMLTVSEDPVVVLRDELGGLVKVVERYLADHKESRNIFGSQELEKVVQLQKEV